MRELEMKFSIMQGINSIVLCTLVYGDIQEDIVREDIERLEELYDMFKYSKYNTSNDMFRAVNNMNIRKESTVDKLLALLDLLNIFDLSSIKLIYEACEYTKYLLESCVDDIKILALNK